MRRVAALLALLLAAGCVEEGARGRVVPLDVPPARDLVPEPEDLPPGWRMVRAEPQPWRAEGFLDGYAVEFVNVSATGRSQVGVLALRFETPDHAARAFASISDEVSGNVTNGTWGDESLVVASESPYAKHVVHLVRKGHAMWLVQRSDDRGGGDAPLDAGALVERLLAKAS